MAASLQLPQRLGALLPPGGEVGVHTRNEGSELWVPVGCGLDRRLVHGEIDVARAAGFEQHLSEIRTDFPIAAEGIHIAYRNSAAQVAFDVLKVFGLLAIDVTLQVQVELVLFDLVDRDRPRILWDFKALVEAVHNLMEALRPQEVLFALLWKGPAAVVPE